MDKLKIINRALTSTGNNPLIELNDGSDEWVAADNAFERAIDFLVAEHQWNFTTETRDLVRAADSPRPPYLHAMAIPDDCWHLRTVFETVYGQPIPYVIVNNQILTKIDTGIRALMVVRPTDETAYRWHPAAVEVLTLLVEADLWKGIGGDPATGDATWNRAVGMLSRAASRVDQQQGPRQTKMSRVGSARRSRKIV